MGGTGNCIVCETFYPGGVGLTDGRCPDCRANFEGRRRPTTRKPRKPRDGGKGN